MKKRFRHILLSVAFLMLFFQSSNAQCKCMSPNICRSFNYADDVIVGVVREVNIIESVKISTFLIEKSFKGFLKGTILLRQSFLKVGDRYLLYPKKVGDYYQVFRCCSRDKKIEDATADLKFLENIGGGNKPLVFGTVTGSLTNLPVKTSIYAFGTAKEYKITTDENGAYLFFDLPIGTFTIRPTLEQIAFKDWYRPPGTKEETFKVKEDICIELNFISLEDKKTKKE